jgi:hypothetical protein
MIHGSVEAYCATYGVSIKRRDAEAEQDDQDALDA